MTTEQRVIEVFATVFKKEGSELSRDTNLVKDLQAKSMNMIELQAVLESEFEIELPLDGVMRAKTIGDFFDIVNGNI
jgi:acyl carrier protein